MKPDKEDIQEIKNIIETNNLNTLSIDESVKVHHCTEGRNNDRLYIKKVEDGWLFHCFHCSLQGKIWDDSGKYSMERIKGIIEKKSEGHTEKSETVKGIHIPKDFNELIPIKGLSHLLKYITNDEIKRMNIGWSDSMKRIVIPIYRNHELNGLLCRSLDEYQIKWINYFKEHIVSGNKVSIRHHIMPNPDSEVLTIVEDILSGIVLLRKTNVMVLNGTYMSDMALRDILAMPIKRVDVWLDDDNPSVVRSQTKLYDRLSTFYPTKVIHLGDPKKC
jgi:hypothetical protein